MRKELNELHEKSFKLNKFYKVDINSPELKFKRHFFGDYFLDLTDIGKVIFHFDESMYDTWFFCRKSWSDKGTS